MQKEIDSSYKYFQSINSVSDLKPGKLISAAEKLFEGSHGDELIHSFLEFGHLPQVNKLSTSSLNFALLINLNY